MKTALFVALGIFTAGFVLLWTIRMGSSRRTMLDAAIGFVTNFFDTLGIGSFATTTSLFRLFRTVHDEDIPGTLNVGHTLPTVVEAFIYVAIISVDTVTLVLMIAASCIGAWFGAGVVSRLPRRKIQVGMGGALLAAAALMVMGALKVLPSAGTALALSGTRLAIGIIVNIALGALMTIGIGLYAPCMILITMLGMDPTAAFPIMMGSCAFLMPVGSTRFIRSGRYNLKAALGLAFGGVPGVLLAAFIVKQLNLDTVRWLVVVVVVYTAAMMLRSAARDRRPPIEPVPAAATD